MIILVVMAFIILMIIVYALLYFSSPLLPSDDCNVPTVGLTTTLIPNGIEIEVTGVTQNMDLSLYEVTVLKDNTSRFDNPRILFDGNMGTGPAGEYLNFTDVDADGRLTRWDFLTLENLASGSLYEVVLSWKECDYELTREVFYAP